MKPKVVVHGAEEVGCWAEVPAIPVCGTEGDTCEELLANSYDAVDGRLSIDA
ncbi:MAG: type II toxin-antitoxin system HicB family antitoxin [Armatimonadetes bacterium]|nr:type II toxin-antitoxin system HicB family antitoxin [Armatimonadota bacterium]